jgi:hypothetical protein
VFFALEMSETTIPCDAKNPGLGRGFLFPGNGGFDIGVLTLYESKKIQGRMAQWQQTR